MASKKLQASLLFLAAFGFCLLGLNPTFYMDDSPETVVVATGLGLDHPPGYPLYTLLGRLFSLLPLSQACFRVNLLAAFLASGVCVLLFFLLQRGFHLRPSLSLAASLLWLAGATAYPAALSAKMGVYQLTALFLMAVLFCLLEGRWRAAFFLYGLSLSNHWMSMAVYGAGLAFLARHFRVRRRGPVPEKGPRFLSEALTWMLVGCTTYLFLPLRGSQNPIVDWGDPVHFNTFLNHLSRRAYAGLGPGFSPLDSLRILGLFLKSSFLEFPGFSLFAVLGAVVLHRRSKGLSLGLLLLWALLPLALGFAHVPAQKAYLLADYSISSYTVLLLWIGIALEDLAGRLDRLGRGARVYAALVPALCLGLLGYRFTQGRQSFYTYTYDYAVSALQSAPDKGLLFCKGDVLDFPCWYLQILEGRRPDLAVLGGGSLPMDWYRIWLARTREGLKVPYPLHDPGKEYIRGRLFLWMVENNPGRPFAFTYPDPSPDGFSGLSLVPYGLTLWGWAGPKAPWDEARAERAWARMRLRHYAGDGRSLDERSWDYFLKDYAMARSWMGVEDVSRATALASSPGNRGKDGAQIRELYQKGLSNFVWAGLWDKDNAQYPLAIGRVFYGLGDDRRGMEWAQKALQADPQNAEAFFLEGIMAYRSGDAQAAEASLARALALNPRYTQAAQALQYLREHPVPTGKGR